MASSVVFFGSGPVAAKSLELLAQEFAIEAVVTKPKPAHHRGDFPVLDAAERLGLKVYTVSNKAGLDSLIDTNPFASQVGVLIDFGIIVSQKTIDYFPKGIVNSHFSLLPEWRGADPITFSILSGQKRTGVSLMLLVEAMDEGPLLAQTPYEISPDTTTASLTEALVELSFETLKAVLPLYLNNEIQPQAQQGTSTYSRKLSKEDGRIDWSKPATQIEREVRAFIEWPKSYTKIAHKDVIITQAHVIDYETAAPFHKNDPGYGEAFITGKSELGVKCGEHSVLIVDKLKPAGKNEMTGREFLAGYGKHL